MPVLDTEVLFAISPNDAKHAQAMSLLRSTNDLVVPDTAFIEFQMVLRARNISSVKIKEAMLDISAVLSENGVKEVRTVGSSLVVTQCELESRYGLTFFDSFIAASALSLDAVVVSDDSSFDLVPGLGRIPLR